MAAVAIGLTAVAAILSAERQLRGAVDRDLLARAVEVRQLADDPAEHHHTAKTLLGIVDYDAVVQAFDKSGQVLLRIGPAGVVLPVTDEDLDIFSGAERRYFGFVQINDRPYRMITTYAERRGLAFQIATDLSRVNENLIGLTRRLFVIWVIGVMLVSVTGWTLASKAVRPITDLTAAAERIAATERLDAGQKLDESAPGEIGRLARAFSSMLDSLSDARRGQQRLVSDAGHEFRTPITALKTNLEILRRKGDSISPEQQADLLDRALDESNRLAGLATELVDLATDVQHSDEEVGEIDLESLAIGVAERYSQPSGKTVTVSGTGSVVRGRRTQLERALGNLVDNGVKWAASQTAIVLDGHTVKVIDDGPGIPEADLPHIFGRFYRSNEARSKQGSGLGLAIVEHLISGHGGTVFAGNSPGGGAEVGFALPPE